MREENLIIIASDVTDENVLAVLAALQAFETAAISKNESWNKLHHQNRKLEFITDIVCDRRYHFIFKSCLPSLRTLMHDTLFASAISYTYICHLSIERGVDLAKGTDKPLALALGIILGCEASTLADVSNLCQMHILDTRILLAHNLDEHDSFLDENAGDKLYCTEGLHSRTLAVLASKVIVGYSSFETYLGCCLKKPVLEVQTNPLLYKWSNPQYRCITDISRIQELVPKGIAECLHMVTKE